MNEFVVQNIEWVVTLAFMAGGGWFLLRSLSTKITEQTRFMEKKFDALGAKDEAHDLEIADHDKRLAVLESKFDTVIRQMQGQLKALYEKLMAK